MNNIFLRLICTVQSTVSYPKINKCNIRNALSSLVSCILLLVYPVRESSSDQSTYLCSICRCIFFPFGMYPDGSFHCARQRRLIFPGEKIHVGLQEMEFHRHVSHQGTVLGKQLITRFLLSFLIFISQKVPAYVFRYAPGPFLGSIQFIFEVGVLKTSFI
jgi:hypothetical protein